MKSNEKFRKIMKSNKKMKNNEKITKK